MSNDQYDLFTGREEAIYLFKKEIDDHDATIPWPSLPILSLMGPAGYGKSRFIRQLYFYHCQTHPHMSLDFNRSGAPRDLLNILGILCDDLRRQHDEQGHTLKFPRFNIIYALLKRSEGQKAEERDEVGELFDDLIGLLGNLHFILGLFLLLLKFVARISFIHAFIRLIVAWGYERAGGKPEWHWYQDQVEKFREFNLLGTAPPPISTLLGRLNEMCLGAPEREFLIEQILPKAFLADLRYGAYDKEPWRRNEPAKRSQGPRRVVVFLDSFEVLLRDAEPVAKHLLQALALNEYRKRGESDPLLLVIGSEEVLPDMSPGQLRQHFPSGLDTDTRTVQERADALFNAWHQQVSPPSARRALSLGNSYLPLPLSTFSLAATREYLLKLDQYNELEDCFTDEALIEDIHRETQGYPIFLERVATALQTSKDGVRNVEQLFAPGEQGEQIVDRLLATHCTPVEERELMLIAIPRTLTRELLGRILNLSDADARSRWQYYHRRPFLLFSEEPQRMAFLPGVRALFLRKLQLVTSNANDTDYDRTHRLLSNYFDDLIRREGPGNEQNLLEYSYHSLALGDYEAVVELACTQRRQPEHWGHLLQVIEQSPTQRLPRATVEQRAAEALDQARLHTDAEEAIRAIVLYTWLLAAPGSEPSLWLKLEAAHNYLHRADPDTRRDMAAYCNQRAIELLTKPELPAPSQTSTQPLGPDPQPEPPNAPVQQRVWTFSRDLYRGVRSSRRAQSILAGVLIITLILLLLIPYLYHAQTPTVTPITDNPFAIPLAQLQPDSHNGIGTTIEPDKEFIGLSDGSIPFDYLRPDASLKIQAANQLRRGNLGAARDLLQQAVKDDINDAEAFIYLENIQIRLSSKPCTVFVVATRIIEDGGEGVNDGRDNLQGAYVAQKEYNNAHQGTPLCLYIANMGNDPGYAPIVARQIVQAAAANKAIEGLIGWPGLLDSSASLDAVNQLQVAHIPIISPDGYDEAQYAANVFHVAPSYQAQGRQAARYAAKLPNPLRAVIITDPTDPYSRGLTEGFKEQFQRDGNQIVGVQTYTTGHTDAQAFAANLHSLLAANPAFIYFAGGLVEGQILLAQLRGSSLPILGGNELYSFVGFSVNTRPDFGRLAFTSPAYPGTTTAQHMKDLYALAFDSQDPGGVREYGYSRPDDRAILSYDAMETLIAGYVNASGLQSLQQVLPSVSVKGASRLLITFTPINELSDQSLFVLFVNQQEQISFTVV